MSQPDTWYTGTLAITPPASEALADELSFTGRMAWTVTTTEIACQDGQRDSDETEANLATIIKTLRALGHTITGEIDWTWEGDGYYFGQFVMVDNKLHHRRGELILGAPEPAE